MKEKILILEDEKELATLYKTFLSSSGFEVSTAHNSDHFFSILKNFLPDLIILDIVLNFSKLSGLQVLKKIKKNNFINCPVIVTSGNASLEEVAKSVKYGAFSFIEKGATINLEKLLLEVKHTLKIHNQEKQILSLEIENINLRKKITKKNQILGNSQAILEIKEQILKFSRAEVDTLIFGATGTGKEVVGYNLYQKSPRNEGPFNKINCSAISKHLIESELFGHKKGSFTGANSDKIGWFEKSSKGVLFLDELNSLPLESQAKILRAIENKEIQVVGGAIKNVDLLMIFTANESLEKLIEKGELRKDLYYRIQGHTIFLPPLIEREDDILIFMQNFLEDYSSSTGKKLDIELKKIAKDLKSYTWPGNIRELKNFCESVVIFETEINNNTIINQFMKKKSGKFINSESLISEKLFEENNYRESLESFEKKYLHYHLKRNNWNVYKTAEKIALERSTIYKKIKHLGIKKENN